MIQQRRRLKQDIGISAVSSFGKIGWIISNKKKGVY